MNKKYKILVIRYDTIGDTIFAIPFYRELKNYYKKNGIIDVLIDYRYKCLLENCKYIDNLIFYEKLNIKNFFKYIKIFKKYDKVYFLKKSSSFSTIAFLSFVKNRIGFNVKGNRFLTKSFYYDESKHISNLYLDLLRAENIPVKNTNLENIFILQKPEYSYEFIAIQAFSRTYLKDWQNEKWKIIIEYIINTLKLKVILLGSEKDYNEYENIITNKEMVFNLAGKIKLEETINLIKNCKLFIGIDSGLIHVASVFKKKSILLNGSTSITHWHPLNGNCSIINKSSEFKCYPCCFLAYEQKNNKCLQTAKCMQAITCDDVISKINLLIN
ncbi:MAG: glycosyltransferase family 9 protein [Candidatus Gastranaerophilales bacterium]|nr:glycosyltransferase family 9 protein [Candidatus Gastranaerophilales bacterium]